MNLKSKRRNRSANLREPKLQGKRVTLRPLVAADFPQWTEVRRRCRGWLLPWEPRKLPNLSDPDTDPKAFQQRCQFMKTEREAGKGYGFGVFANGHLIGEMNMSSVMGHPFYSCYVGYWIDQSQAGQSYAPEALAAVLRFGFEECLLYRMQVAIVPTNSASLRVVEKLGIPTEGIARKFLEINGTWEDHQLFAMTIEDWEQKGGALTRDWLEPVSSF